MSLDSLHVYVQSQELSDRVAQIVKQWNVFDQRTLGSQLVRAADSVSNNIAEGYGRSAMGEKLQFCLYSLGSALETRNCLKRAQSRGLMQPEQSRDLANLCYSIYRSALKLAYVQLSRDSSYNGPLRALVMERWERLSKRKP
ncbi:MAG: four helix bundle protein [Candidatus Kapaibacterium sp.]